MKNMFRNYLLAFGICGLTVALALLAMNVVAPAVYQSKLDELDLSPGSVGSPADGSVPVVTALEEMQNSGLFVLQNLEPDSWDRNDGGSLGGVYYYKITLADGTVLAARYNSEAKDVSAVTDSSGQRDYSHVQITYPIGTLRPWPEGAAQDAAAADWLTYRDGWLDAEGDFGAELPDYGHLRAVWTIGLSAAGLIVGIGGCVALDLRREKRQVSPGRR